MSNRRERLNLAIIIAVVIALLVLTVRKPRRRTRTVRAKYHAAEAIEEPHFDDRAGRADWSHPVEPVEELVPAIEEETRTEPSAVLIPVVTGYVYKPEDSPQVQAAKKVKCRHRWTKYLRQNLPSPNERLDALLKRYTRLHDKHLRELALEDALKLPLNSRANKIRYLVWRPAEEGGLSGQLLSLVSAFLMALLTDRVLLVDLPEDIEHVLCEPFPNSPTWLVPEHIKMGLYSSAPKAMLAVKQRQPMRSARLHIERGNPTDDKHLLSCHGTLKNVFGHIQWLVVQADYDFIDVIANNKAHLHQISTLFDLDQHTIYAVLHRYLLHPSNFLWEKITERYHVYFSDDDPKPLRVVMHPGHGRHLKAISSLLAPLPDYKTVSIYLTGDRSLAEDEKEWIGEMKKKVRFGTSKEAFKNPSKFVNDWRIFLTDIWMASWATHYIIPEDLPAGAVPGLLYRDRLEGAWILRSPLGFSDQFDLRALPALNATAELVDCSLIKRK